MSRLLLIDADIAVFRYSHVNQQALEWDADTWSYFGDLTRAKTQLDGWIDDVVERLEADDYTLCLSDSTANWRHDVLLTYKGHRASWHKDRRSKLGELPPAPGPQRPMLHGPLREWLIAERGGKVVPSLEADDLLGIAATDPKIRGEKIIVSADKDLATVPGLLWNPDKADDGVRKIGQREADYNHLYLVLVGDTSDGYTGCKGVGPVKAKALLDHEQSWATVVAAYEKAGMTADDALVQARVARVCRHSDYNPETGEIRLWSPK